MQGVLRILHRALPNGSAFFISFQGSPLDATETIFRFSRINNRISKINASTGFLVALFGI